MSEQKSINSQKVEKAKPHPSPTAARHILTRDYLEESMIRWAYTKEGPIAGNFIVGLIGHGAVLQALESVAESMQAQPDIFDDDVAMVQTAWMNYQEYGSPGFPVSSASTVREQLTASIQEVDIDEEE